jgi:transketolase
MIKKLRNRILEVALRDGMGHIPSALSILDIVWVLYDKVMTPDDQFILSKGHGCMALYAVLEEKGIFDWLSTKAQGHPKRGGAILASTGSLGHGLPMSVGLALAKKIKEEPGRVFCLVGDGECNEGTTWESAMVAAHHKLDNLVVIVDQNHSSDRALDTDNLPKKFESFGAHVRSINGNDAREIEIAMDEPEHNEEYLCVIANTIKANGVPFMQYPSWHNRKITREEYNQAIQ